MEKFNKVTILNKANQIFALTYHQWECNGNTLDAFDDPKNRQTDNLYEGKEMDTFDRYVTDKGVVRLVLGRHKHDQNSLD